MRTFQILIILCLLFSVGTSKAQQIDRIQRGQRGYVPPPKQTLNTYIELKDPHHEASFIVPACEKEFKLDAFQKEIFKSLLIKKIEDENAILSDEKNTREDRKQKLISRNNLFFVELESIMTKEQIDTFKHMDFTEDEKEHKKKKKREKKKKNKS